MSTTLDITRLRNRISLFIAYLAFLHICKQGARFPGLFRLCTLLHCNILVTSISPVSVSYYPPTCFVCIILLSKYFFSFCILLLSSLFFLYPITFQPVFLYPITFEHVFLYPITIQLVFLYPITFQPVFLYPITFQSVVFVSHYSLQSNWS